MILEQFKPNTRRLNTKELECDFLVVGGGMSGVCAALTAARAGVKVILVQDRPVLGGNASSEVRLWILGATSHMGNNNRYSREGGIIDEILIENLYRNKEGNPLILDTILLEKVIEEPNITLYLNTSVHQVDKVSDREIGGVRAFCSQNSTEYYIKSRLYCDASGDGIMAFQAGAAFRMGAEASEEFGEKFAPDKEYGELLGHSLYFYSKRVDHPVKYVAPSYALKDIKKIPRYKVISEKDYGCRLWWIEYGGRGDTVHETEEIKWELWKVVYGVWDYIKNGGAFEDTENLTLEWVGTIPGKRESRRFEGLYMMKQQDIVEQREFEDAVAFGGWAIDLHPADGLYTSQPGCNQWHSKGVYQIPLRSYVSRDIDNLLYAGRIISASHVAFGSTRVMATCAHGGQAVGETAAVCIEQGIIPKEVFQNGALKAIQNRLNSNGQSIPGIPLEKRNDLVTSAKIKSSSILALDEIPFDGDWLELNHSTAQMLPFSKGLVSEFTVQIEAEKDTILKCELKVSSKVQNFTPDQLLGRKSIHLQKGEQTVTINFEVNLPHDQYGFVIFRQNEKVRIKTSQKRITGILSVFQKVHKAVSNNGIQKPDKDIGVDTFELWRPERRPGGQNLAMRFSPALKPFKAEYLRNGFLRPHITSNAWVGSYDEKMSRVEFRWDQPISIRKIRIYFDPDYDHPLESSLMGHPEDIIPFTVRNISVKNCNEEEIAKITDNYLAIRDIVFEEPVITSGIKFDIERPSEHVPASLFEVSIT